MLREWPAFNRKLVGILLMNIWVCVLIFMYAEVLESMGCVLIFIYVQMLESMGLCVDFYVCLSAGKYGFIC